MTPDYDWEDRFNRWYNTHYIPIRMEAPGFISAQRYRDAERPNYLALYELESEQALESEAYQNIQAHPNAETKWILANVADSARYLGTEISDQRRKKRDAGALDAPVLYPVFYSVPDEAADEFNAWYTDELVPQLLKCEDWLACRRFLIFDGEPQPWTHLALHYLNDLAAFDSPEWEAAREMEAKTKFAEEPWFNASYHVFERWGERFEGTS